MKKRFKAILGRVAALASALPFVLSSLAFPSLSASAAVNIQLDSLTVRGLIGDTLKGYYVDSDRNYKSCEFTFNSYQTMSDRYFTPSGSYASGTQILLLYTCPLPVDIGQDLPQQDAIISVDLGLHLDNVTHFEMIFGAWISGYYTTAAYSALNTYNYILSTAPALPESSITAGDQFRTSLSHASFNNNRGGYFGLNGVYDVYSSLYYNMDSSISGSVSIDTVQFSCLAMGTNLCFGITLPYVNLDVEIPSNISDSFPASGKAEGTVSENSSGGYDIDYDFSIDVPDYSSRFEDLESAINPSLDSSQADIYDKFDSEGEEYHNLENSLLDNMASQIDNMDSIAFEFDPTYVEEAEDFTPLFNYPLVMWMTNLVLIISLISFLIFGKWV